MHAQKRDKNESTIIKAYQDVGAYVRQMDKNDGFDLLVCHQGTVYIVEVKNTRASRTRDELIKMLTDNEYKMMQAVEATGARYHIVTNTDEALSILMPESWL